MLLKTTQQDFLSSCLNNALTTQHNADGAQTTRYLAKWQSRTMCSNTNSHLH